MNRRIVLQSCLGFAAASQFGFLSCMPSALAGVAPLSSALPTGSSTPETQMNSTVILGFVSGQTNLFAKYHGEGLRGADLREASITAGLLDAEFVRTSMYPEIDSWIQGNRSQVMNLDMANVDRTPMFKVINSLAQSVGVTPAVQMRDLDPIFDQGDYSKAKTALLSTGSSKWLSGYVTALNSAEADLGDGVFAASLAPQRPHPQVEPATCFLRAIPLKEEAAFLGLVAAVAVLCPECDVVLLTTGTVVLTVGGVAAVTAAVLTLIDAFNRC